MKSNRKGPIWPYLTVLVVLFGLSLNASRSWRSGLPALEAGQTTRLAAPADGNAGRSDPTHAEHELDPSGHAPPAGPGRGASPRLPISTDAQPIAAVAADRDEHLPCLAIASVVSLRAIPARADVTLDEPEDAGNQADGLDRVPMLPLIIADDASQPHSGRDSLRGATMQASGPGDRLAMRPSLPLTVNGLRRLAPAELAAKSRNTPSRLGQTAFRPAQLLEQLSELNTSSSTSRWAEETARRIDDLFAANASVASTARALESLESLAAEVDSLVAAMDSPDEKKLFVRARYALRRRLDVWQALAQSDQDDVAGYPTVTIDQEVLRQLEEMATLVGGTPQGSTWQRYLLLDELQEALEEPARYSLQARTALAGRIIRRLNDPRLNEDQTEFLRRGPALGLENLLGRWTALPLNDSEVVQLLSRVESYEQTGSAHDAEVTSEILGRLSKSPLAAQNRIAEAIDRHYRNANLRLAVSDDFLNRFAPSPRPLDVPVNDRIGGANVYGNSRTVSKLHVRMVPDGERLRFGLEAHGAVRSDTRSVSGPVTFYNEGQTAFVARKLVVLDENGLKVWPAICEAVSESSPRGMRSEYDNVPIVRNFVRRAAEGEYGQTYNYAMARVEDRVSRTARQQLDAQADPQLRKMNDKLRTKLIDPLRRLGLEPTPVRLYTTEDRMIARVRLANDRQLGGHTPRPCAPSDSLFSLQVHESVLNNVATQLELDGRTMSLPDIYQAIGRKLGRTIAIPEDLPDDVLVRFADHDALSLMLTEGRLAVTFRIAELSQGSRSFTDFEARTYYRPVSGGLRLELERDGIIELGGSRQKLGAQIILRGVFAKVFNNNTRPQIIDAQQANDPRLAGLKLTQLAVEDGWLALAVGPARSPNEVVRRSR